MAMGGLSNHPCMSVEAAISDPHGAAANKIRAHLVTVLKTLVEAQESGSLEALKFPFRSWGNIRDAG